MVGHEINNETVFIQLENGETVLYDIEAHGHVWDADEAAEIKDWSDLTYGRLPKTKSKGDSSLPERTTCVRRNTKGPFRDMSLEECHQIHADIGIAGGFERVLRDRNRVANPLGGEVPEMPEKLYEALCVAEPGLKKKARRHFQTVCSFLFLNIFRLAKN